MIRAYALGWRQADGEDHYDETAAMIVSPPVFTIPPGGSQIVRVGPRAPARAAQPYRLIIEEVPEAAPGTGIRVALRLNLPLYIRMAAGAPADLSWSARRGGDGQWTDRGAQWRRRLGPRRCARRRGGDRPPFRGRLRVRHGASGRRAALDFERQPRGRRRGAFSTDFRPAAMANGFRLRAPARLGARSFRCPSLPARRGGAGRRSRVRHSSAQAASYTPALYEVTSTARRPKSRPQFLRDADGRLYIAAASLRGWRLRLPAAAAMRHDGEDFYPAAAFRHLRFAFDEQAQRIAINADPAAFELQQASLDDGALMPMTPAGFGAFLNYDLFAEHVARRDQRGRRVRGGRLHPRGAGVSSFIASAGGGRTRFTRLETNWTIDRPYYMTSIRIGDSISAAGPGASPVRFAGIQYARNFACPARLSSPCRCRSRTAAPQCPRSSTSM